MGGIFLIRSDDELVEMTEQPYDSEDVLQTLLAKYPNLLAGDQIDSTEPRRWLLVTREMGVPSADLQGARWAVDHLFLDQDGIPTLVEVKRSSDTRLRREVVGQLLEYAANAAVYWPVERINAELEHRCEEEGRDAEALISDLLGTDADSDAYWETVRTNLQAGRLRLVFVADVIPQELRRIVEFLNEQMDPTDVFAIEVKQFVGGNLTTLVPRLIGINERKRGASATRKREWTEEDVLAQLRDRHGNEIAEAARKLLSDLRAIEGVEIRWGQGIRTGSFSPGITKGGTKYPFFTLYSFRARMEYSFATLKNRPEFESEDRREELRQHLNSIEGFSISEDGIDKWPSLPVAPLADAKKRQQFIAVLNWLIGEIRQT